jgi:hypothetical protein
MATLEAVRDELESALFDSGNATWSTTELDYFLQRAVTRLALRAPKPVATDASAATITLVSETYYYSIDSSIIQVDAVMYENSDEDLIGYMQSGWEISGDLWAGTAKLHVSPTTVEQGGKLYIRGWQKYDLVAAASDQTNAITVEHVPYVVAASRVEAYDQLLSDRARFYQWQNENQVQNISVNELVQMRAEAEQTRDYEWSLLKRWQRPTIGRIG